MPMRIVGIDENGLGPLLGPLLVTAVSFEAAEYDRQAFWNLAKPPLIADDSKKVFSKTKRKEAERATLAWLEAFDVTPPTFLDLRDRICFNHPFEMPCERDIPSFCRSVHLALPAFAPVEPKSLSSLIQDRIKSWPIRPCAVSTIALCPGAFNKALQNPAMNKLRLDFELMMALAEHSSRGANMETKIICGKVGSTRKYRPWLEALGFHLRANAYETKEQSRYVVSELGQVEFIKDADAKHLPVAVASMIGKYVRELFMFDLNRRLGTPGTIEASGYRDPVTAKFVEQTALKRKEMGLPSFCFLRNS